MKRLPDGGTIGVAACASPYDMRSELDRGVQWWEAQGYRVKLGPGVHDRDDSVAGDPKQFDQLCSVFIWPPLAGGGFDAKPGVQCSAFFSFPSCTW